jgi:hypothetical protein
MWMGGAGPLRPEDDKVYEANDPKVASFRTSRSRTSSPTSRAYLPKPGAPLYRVEKEALLGLLTRTRLV